VVLANTESGPSRRCDVADSPPALTWKEGAVVPGTELRPREATVPEGHRSGARRLVGRVVLVLVLLGVLVVGGLWLAEYSLYRQVGRIDADLGAPRERPVETVAERDAVDVAVIGTAHGRWVSQMLLHIAADRRSASFVSVPDAGMRLLPHWRQSMPAQPAGQDVARVAARIEKTTGHRVEHVAILDWRAVAELTDRLDGLDLWVGPAGADARWPEAFHVTGETVLDVVDRGPCLVGRPAAVADARRIHREQALLAAVLDRTLHQELVRSPVALYRDLDVLAENLTIDSGWSQRDLVTLVVSLRHLRSHAITYETAPALGELQPSGTAC
jgi:anionic cell wall polymer biosynthesis LytR-Cps2A-Psr (LCP) family protein